MMIKNEKGVELEISRDEMLELKVNSIEELKKLLELMVQTEQSIGFSPKPKK